MTRILFVGQKPETVDFSDPSLPPGFDAQKINAGIAVAVAKIEERGWQGDTCMMTPDADGSAMLEKALNAAAYDCVVIGGGLRLPPKPGAVRDGGEHRPQGRAKRGDRVQHAARRHRRCRRSPPRGWLTGVNESESLWTDDR
jgi:hypothetical protein